MKGLDVLMDFLYFQSGKKYFKQINALSIGLVVSLIIVDKLNMLVHLVNSYHNILRCTFEIKNNNQINHLDVEVIKNNNGPMNFDS